MNAYYRQLKIIKSMIMITVTKINLLKYINLGEVLD